MRPRFLSASLGSVVKLNSCRLRTAAKVKIEPCVTSITNLAYRNPLHAPERAFLEVADKDCWSHNQAEAVGVRPQESSYRQPSLGRLFAGKNFWRTENPFAWSLRLGRFRIQYFNREGSFRVHAERTRPVNRFKTNGRKAASTPSVGT
jgi:hypothetical protein